jgi:hypothetical protein
MVLRKKGVWIVGVDAAGEQLWTELISRFPLRWFLAVSIAVCDGWSGSTVMLSCACRCWVKWNR